MASIRLRRAPSLAPRFAASRRSCAAPCVRTYSALSSLSELSRPPTHVKPLSSASKYVSISHPRKLFSTSPHLLETVVKVPQMAESISEGTLSGFSKQVGDHVEQDEEIASIETDKIDVSVNAPAAGKITELLVNEGDTVTVDQAIAKIDEGAEGESSSGKEGGEEQAKQPAEPKQEEKQDSTPPPEPKKEEPKQEKPAQTQSKADKPEQSQPKQEKAPAPKKEDAPKPAASSESQPSQGSRGENRVKMNRMRLRIAERLKQSQNTAASLTTFNEVDMSAIMELRKKYKDEILKKHGVKFGFMSAFAKAAILAMKEVPAVNASIEGPNGGDTIVYRDYVDISVAVATPKGLVTPVLRNAESKSMIEIEKGIADLGAKARDGKLSIEDMAGGSFTISNGGVFGSMMGTPIINLPQTAVLGLHAIKERAVVINGKVEVRPMMYLALTYDHRLLDGREAVTFLVLIQKYLQDPASMLLI